METHILWSKLEQTQVAQAMFERFPGVKATARFLLMAQTCLPMDRQKRNFAPPLLASIRFEIDRIASNDTPEDPMDSTDAVHNGAYDLVCKEQPPLPPEEFNIAVPLKHPAVNERASPPTLEARSSHAHPITPSSDCEQMVAALVEINHLVIRLKQFTAGQYQQACSHPINAGRMRNLCIQASNGLEFFEQLTRLTQ